MLKHIFCKCRKINWLSSKNFSNVITVFGFNCAKYDINLINSYLLPILINGMNMEPTVIKKANQFVSVNFGDVQLPDIMNFLVGATSPDLFLKACKKSETKSFFPYEQFDSPQKLKKSDLPPYDAFFSKHRHVNPGKMIIQIIKNCLAADWRLKKHYPKWSFPNHRLQEKKTTNICLMYGIMRLCAHFKTFYAGTTKRRCSKFRSKAKNICFLTEERN